MRGRHNRRPSVDAAIFLLCCSILGLLGCLPDLVVKGGVVAAAGDELLADTKWAQEHQSLAFPVLPSPSEVVEDIATPKGRGDAEPGDGCGGSSADDTTNNSDGSCVWDDDDIDDQRLPDGAEGECTVFFAPSSLTGERFAAGYGLYTTVATKARTRFDAYPNGVSVPVVTDDDWLWEGFLENHGAGDAPVSEGIVEEEEEDDDDDDDPMLDPEAIPLWYGLQRDFREWNGDWDHYWWGVTLPAHVMYTGDFALDYHITWGALPNHHCALASIDSEFPVEHSDEDDLLSTASTTTPSSSDGNNAAEDVTATTKDTDESSSARRRQQSLLRDRLDPGSGAFVTQSGRFLLADRDLVAGEEIFLNYGMCERGKTSPEETDQHVHSDWNKVVREVEDYRQAAHHLWTVGSDYHANRTAAMRLNASQDFPLPQLTDLDRLLPDDLDPYVKDVLPTTDSGLAEVWNGTASPKELAWKLARTTLGNTPRTPDWIRKHGRCINHLYPAPSTIPHAGRGGFTRHTIREGHLIAPVPMLHVPNREVLRIPTDRGRWHLMLNYCFGRADSTVLLCPVTNGNLLNHCSTRRPDLCPPDPVGSVSANNDVARGPNAAYRRATGWPGRSNEKGWDRTVEDLAGDFAGTQTAIEVYALRVIEAHDEVTVDYGKEWEEAWDEHVQQWKESVAEQKGWATTPVYSAHKANQHLNKTGAVPDQFVSGSLTGFVQDDYISPYCFYWADKDADFRPAYRDEHNWTSMDDKDILSWYSDDGSHFMSPGHSSPYPLQDDHSYWPCAILVHDNDNDRNATPNDDGNPERYTVRILNDPDPLAQAEDELFWEITGTPRLLRNYPATSIHFLVRPFAADQFQSGVFRQPLEFRDDIWPDQWRSVNR